jgi:hypothetical protein
LRMFLNDSVARVMGITDRSTPAVSGEIPQV